MGGKYPACVKKNVKKKIKHVKKKKSTQSYFCFVCKITKIYSEKWVIWPHNYFNKHFLFLRVCVIKYIG